MFKKILVPSDFSDAEAKVFSTATALVDDKQGVIILLHVIEVLKDVPFDELREFYQGIERSTRARMNSVAAALEVGGSSVRSVIRYGNRLSEILAACKEDQIDLMALQSHPFNPAQPHDGWGTLSQRLAIVAPCAVLLVR